MHKFLLAKKQVRSCGGIVGGSAVPAYYDGGGFGAKCKDFAVSDERLPTATMMAIRVSLRGPKADIHAQPSPGRQAAPKTDVKTAPSRVAGPRAAPPKSSLFFVGLLLRGRF